ncbi:hypothetical protein ACEWY4_012758 [Coilia grayii]|uniref:Uncharacterized protein n=1 Tax=Coilia grayii TaxID=363190 RepID=A0ABD1JUJ0_9TELE
MAEPKNVKVLLLGANEAGKSTILKQMKIIYLGGYTDEERLEYRAVIYSNILQFTLAVLQGMGPLEIKFGSPSSEANAKKLQTMAGSTEEGTMPADMSEIIVRLWADAGFKACVERANMYDVNDSTAYYMDHMDRIFEANYLPTEQDVLFSRVDTSATVEEQFPCKELLIRMFDVGGKREDRKGWIKSFTEVTCIIFVCSLSAYDQVLVEDEETNRMHESLHLFNSISNHKFFGSTTIVLFLNKTDVFKQKIQKSPLSICFPQYGGGNSYDEGSNFIKQQFVDLHLKNSEKEIYTHMICATDTKVVQTTFNNVAETIVKNLKACGLY